MNPMELIRLKQLFNVFKEAHPKFPLFLKAAAGYVREGSIIEIKVTSPEGREIVTNLKATNSDIELLNELIALDE